MSSLLLLLVGQSKKQKAKSCAPDAELLERALQLHDDVAAVARLARDLDEQRVVVGRDVGAHKALV